MKALKVRALLELGVRGLRLADRDHVIMAGLVEAFRSGLLSGPHGQGANYAGVEDIGARGGRTRTALNALELAVESTTPDANGVIHIDDRVAEESIQRRVVRYDRRGGVPPPHPRRHSYAGRWVAQQYLPDIHKDRRFYNPSGQGYEAGVKERVEKWRGAEKE